ncbi:hypothetical protein LCGC14_3154940 [marine sediment metagenome]|uniref:DUF547 domain-containing protein n=1 Tax=marine sediment metagenome TaxID=412755 RepID=A0A0F8VT29_9ZZZZ
MKRQIKIMLGVVLALLVLTGAWAYVAHREFVGTETFDEAFYAAGGNHSSEFSYDDYATVLRKHVDDKGMVSYAGLKENPEELNRFVRALAVLEPKTYEGWDETAKIAFWINAYNALTLKAIINHYPIKAGLISGLAYPANSIRQIPGVWDKLQFLVMGQKMTLNQIEHETLRAKFNEPRIHTALVCAAVGCPQLRNEPFVGEKLNAQLDDQSKGFVTNPAKFRIDRDNGKVYLSSIFKWFGGDFVKSHAPQDRKE